MSRAKDQIGKLIREIGSLFTTSDAATALNVSNIEASKMLSRWVIQGWLTRVRRGLYAIVPLEAVNNQQTLEES